MAKKLKIYLGCSLTQASDEFKTGIEDLKNKLRKNYEILDFLGLVNGTPTDVFLHDTKCIKTCDVFVAICTYPAIGLGYELGAAIYEHKPILALAQDQAKVTRMVLGINSPGYEFSRYNNLQEIPGLLKKFIIKNKLN